jgi:glycosyltransferase involved in cell wall biosynthesis
VIPANLWIGLLAASVWLLALGWTWQLWQWLRHSGEVADLTQSPSDNLSSRHDAHDNLPHATVIVPACNEEASIEATVRSLLASKGLRLQILAVDDRSSDRTGEIMDRIAAETASQRGVHSIEILHIADLPQGWLGKPHALATAAKLASADWLLFTDADVIFAPEAVSMALRYAFAECADHLVLLPEWIMGTHGERAMHGAIHAFTTWTFRPWRVADPRAGDFIGVGAFNLVRSGTYRELGGFEALRMEVIEDLRFGWMVKRAGFRQRVARGPGLARVRWSEGAWGVVRNLEKNLFALYRYRVGLALLASFGLTIQIVLPIAALVLAVFSRYRYSLWAGAGAVVLYATVAGLYIASRKATRVPPDYVLLYPLAATLILFAVLRSVTLTLWRGGVAWRGTLYSLKELRANAGKFW